MKQSIKIKLHKRQIFLFLFVLLSIKGFSQSGKIKGSVSGIDNNAPIPFATISVEGTQIATTSDAEGNFIIENIAPGYYKLYTQVMDYESQLSEEFEIRPNKTTNIEIQLEKQTYNINEVVVKSSPFKRQAESPVSMRSLGVSEIEKTPGASRDISRVIQALPGVSSSTATFRNDVIVRGGGPAENVFYIDGIEIPTINHFSTQGASGGPVGIVNADFVSKLDFHTGAFPSYAGEALSSVLAFKMLNGNDEKLKYKATLGASDLSLTVDGPILKNTTGIFSVRRSYLQFLFGLLKLPFLPTYNDYQLKTRTKFNNKNELIIVSLGALDNFKLNTGIKDPDELQQYIVNNLPVFNQWSYVIGGAYKHYSEKGYSKLIVSRNFLNNNITKYKNNDESAPENLQLNIKSFEIENKIRFEQVSRIKGFKIAYGAGYEYSKYSNDIYQKVLIFGNLITLDVNSDFRLNSWGVFGQVSKSLLNKRLTLSAGVRADANDYSSNMYNLLKQISPRFSVSYALTEKLFLNANAGRYHKRPEYTTLGYKNRDNVLINKQNKIKYIASNQYVTGLEWRPLKNTKITGEFFYKDYAHYPMSVKDGVALSNKGANYGITGSEEIKSTGKGRAYGFEFFTRMPSYKKFNVLLSYTYVRSEFEDTLGTLIPSAWDNRHIVNLTLMKSFKHNWDVGLKWRYSGGLPYSPYDMEKSKVIAYWDIQNEGFLDYSKFNSLRLSNSHQLDLRIDKTFYFKKVEFGFYIDLQNVYNFKVENQPYLTNLDENGKANINPDNNNEYILRKLESRTGTIIPSIGMKITF